MTAKAVTAIATIVIVGGLCAAAPANAAIIDSTTNQIISSGLGDILVRFESSEAGDKSQISAPDYSSAPLFNNKDTTLGAIFNIGFFEAGQTIRFQLENLARDLSFFTGLAGDNPDNFMHARLTGNADGSVRVSFEDLPGGGDRDYDDLEFTVSEAASTDPAPLATPIPATATLLLSGLAGLGFAARRKKAF